ncbi:hypothetical protein C8R46DRAFT_279405 [Mycena filopes]|nr:hypothetical protein C8R46DRAFT_279405 [Mycena filopes]
MSNLSLEEATYYFFPKWDLLCALYPTLKSHQRMEAWITDYNELFREAGAVYMAAHPEEFPPGASLDPSGSFFSSCGMSGAYHYDPPQIVHRHQGFTYKVTTPVHVAALHAFRAREPSDTIVADPQNDYKQWLQQCNSRPSYVKALAYLFANYDSRVPWKPITLTVPEGWHLGVWPYVTHPDEQALYPPPPGFDRLDQIPAGMHDPVQFPVMSDVRAAAKAAGKHERTRYTLIGWRKMEEREQTCWDIWEKQRYMVEHFDLKQVFDKDKRVVSSEWAADYQIETQMPRL